MFNPAWLYVGAVYAAAVAVARRMHIDLPWRVAAAFYLLVLVFLFRPLTGPYVNTGVDTLKLIPPWSASAPDGFDKYDVANYELGDVAFQIVPWAHQVREQWRQLRLPLWNERAGSGMPLLANMQSGAMSPLRLITLPLPLASVFAAEGALKILTALTFTYLYCRGRGYAMLPAVAGAIAFAFGTFVGVWLHFPNTSVAVLLPAVFFQIDLLAGRRTTARLFFAAFLGFALLAGGHPETAAHIVFVAALYALWLAAVERKKVIGTLAIACVAALFIAAPVLLPVLETLRKTVRYEETRQSGHVEATAYSDFASLALLVNPRLYGERPGPLWHPALTENVCGFAGILGIGAAAGLLVHSIRRRRLRSREMFFAVCFALLLLVVADAPLISAPVRAIFSLALNARLRLELTFLAAVQTAALIHFGRRDRAAVIAAVTTAIGAVLLVMLRTPFPTGDAREFAIRTFVPSLVVLVLAAALPIRRLHFTIASILALAIYAELWGAWHGWHPVAPRSEFHPRTPLIAALQTAARDAGAPYRVCGIGPALFPNTQAMFGLEDVRVHDPMANRRYFDVLRTSMPDFTAADYYAKWNDARTPLLDYLNVRWLVTPPRFDPGDAGRYRLLYDGPDGRVFENLRVRPRFFAARNVLLVPDFSALPSTDLSTTALVRVLPAGEAAGRDLLSPRPADSVEAAVELGRASPVRYELGVDAPRHTLVVSSIPYWPGWRVRHQGRSLRPLLVNGAFLGFVVPPGSGTVRVTYFPGSFWGGIVLALAGSVALAVCGARASSAVRREPTAGGICAGG